MDLKLAALIAAALAAAAGSGALAGSGAVYVFNRIPASWLCDYGEIPDERHLPPRIGKYPWAPLFSLVFAAAALKAGLVSLAYSAAALPALWLLLLIGVSDRKYMIIPDQFVIMLAATGIGFAAIGHSFLSPLLGLAAGGLVFLLMALAGRLISKRDTLGMGDVKLAAVCGLITGLHGIIVIMALTALSSAALFSLWLASGRIKARDEAPLGPFIAGSTAVYLIFSQEISGLAARYVGLAPG
ncbi:MAG: A24 family peptidase [Clostridiales Family XIII bacterium]|jgi:prepilin signal peptidase PulO-like enzyme (type II secretory pathway)|nr:A24 family peptidase [Clostridiales Family XIII bacterium]